MNESITKYQMRHTDNSKDPIILDNRNREKFLNELSDGEVYIEILQKKSKLRTYLQNRYLFGGVYSEFIPSHFQTVETAHEYFTHLYLKNIDVFLENETDLMQKALSKASRILSNRFYTSFNGNTRVSKLEVVWVQSTAGLSTKEFNNYIESIKVSGAELGIEIKDPSEFYEQI